MKVTNYRKSSHTVYDIKFHIVWITKYRYKILKGNIAHRLVALLKQGCEAKEIEIIKGHVSQDHVHMLISIPPNLSISDVVRYLKGRSSHLLQDEFPELKRQYWGQHMWARGYFCATIGEITEEMIKEYIENHKDKENFSISDDEL
jgi:putative transposase